jgi:hypothetical protein
MLLQNKSPEVVSLLTYSSHLPSQTITSPHPLFFSAQAVCIVPLPSTRPETGISEGLGLTIIS